MELQGALSDLSKISLNTVLHQPFQTQEKIREGQFERIRYLVDLACREVPVYSDKYRAAGIDAPRAHSCRDPHAGTQSAGSRSASSCTSPARQHDRSVRRQP